MKQSHLHGQLAAIITGQSPGFNNAEVRAILQNQYGYPPGHPACVDRRLRELADLGYNVKKVRAGKTVRYSIV